MRAGPRDPRFDLAGHVEQTKGYMYIFGVMIGIIFADSLLQQAARCDPRAGLGSLAHVHVGSRAEHGSMDRQ